MQLQVTKKILVISNTAWYLYNFRLNLMQSLQNQGYSIMAVAPYDKYADKIEQQGIAFFPMPMNGKGTNPIEDLGLISRLYKLFKKEKPAVILTYTPKPNIYSSIAARFLKIPVINNIAGLGNAFINPGIVTQIAIQLYKLALRSSKKVFFQNNDDLSLFLEKKLVKETLAERIPGSGVDTHKFSPLTGDRPRDRFVFLLVARMLWDKGVGDLVEAMRILKARYPQVECQLLGFLDVQNPTAISKEQMQRWVDEGLVTYLGVSDNVADVMRTADCVVLPSYREGVPRTMLEAASLAKPIITTDSVGCRDVIDEGVNGFLCKPKNAQDLADKMERMINLPEAERIHMGQQGREKMLREFDERIVIQRYLEVVEAVAGGNSAPDLRACRVGPA